MLLKLNYANLPNLGFGKYGKSNPNYGNKGLKNPLSKKVVQYDKKTRKIIKQWDCIADVERTIGIRACYIIECCKNRRKTAGGYIWKYDT